MHPILEGLAKLSAAEQFFDALAVPFEQEVLNVSRLHILKAFHDRLRKTNLDGLDDVAARTLCATALAECYQAFAAGKGAKTFKLFNQQQSQRAFVPLADLRRE